MKAKTLIRWHARAVVLLSCVGLCCMLAGEEPKESKQAKQPSFEYRQGPLTVQIGDMASVSIPKGQIYIDQTNVPAFMNASHNLPAGDELAVIANAEFSWFAIYRFDSVGYVKDDEKDSLDADKILEQMRAATAEANETLKAKGWETLNITGWKTRPHYDSATNNLEWCVEASASTGEVTLNHDIRLLGRRGVMKARLVSATNTYSADLLAFRELNRTFKYNTGNEYSAWVKGDKVAEYGLGALILGGGVAAAAKMGLLKTLGKFMLAFWKLAIAGVLALWALLKRIFGSRGAPAEPETAPGGESSDG